MKSIAKRCLAAGGAVLVSGLTASAQITNDPTVITTGIASHYNTAAGLGIAALVVGFAVYFIRKGAKLRS